MTDNVLLFPVDKNAQLTFEQAVSVAEQRKPVSGIMVTYDEDDDIGIFTFGDVSRKDALWMAHQIIRHGFDEEIS